MSELRTTELRWFFPGAAPDGVRNLFVRSRGLPPTEPACRTDSYVRCCDDALGVKLREGRLEVKRRRAREPAPSPLDGWVERWTKWSWAIDDALEGLHTADADWLEVEKSRVMWKIAQGENGPRVLPSADTTTEGGTLEVTEIVVSGERHWTVGGEVFEHGAGSLALLVRAVPLLLSELGIPRPDRVRSFGYPALLASIVSS